MRVIIAYHTNARFISHMCYLPDKNRLYYRGRGEQIRASEDEFKDGYNNAEIIFLPIELDDLSFIETVTYEKYPELLL